MFWNDVRAFLANLTGLSHDALQVHAGLAVFVLAAILLRRTRRNYLYAWLILVLLIVLNEFGGALLRGARTARPDYWVSAREAVQLLFWPTALLLLERYAGALGRRR